ncbi:MAG: hypothetical protein Q4D96_09300 [Propionibacteriaceae bacterium]|nr:hypothetical protein [Propionibacteriaceae bacterium]
MVELEQASDEELGVLDHRLRRERLRRRGAWRSCQHCATSFLGREGALYCSARCRVAAFRARKGRVS